MHTTLGGVTTLDIAIWGFHCGVVDVFTLLGLWIGSLFLRFWDKVCVPHLKRPAGHQQCVSEGMAGKLM